MEARWELLGYQRNRLLACLGADGFRGGLLIDPAARGSVFDVYRDYVSHVAERWAGDTDPVSRRLLAAGRLLTGDLAGADTILDLLPAAAYTPDHGAGFCLVLPMDVLGAVLPTPQGLKGARGWVAGSVEAAALRAWLAEWRDRLVWAETTGVYFRVV